LAPRPVDGCRTRAWIMVFCRQLVVLALERNRWRPAFGVGHRYRKRPRIGMLFDVYMRDMGEGERFDGFGSLR